MRAVSVLGLFEGLDGGKGVLLGLGGCWSHADDMSVPQMQVESLGGSSEVLGLGVGKGRRKCKGRMPVACY